ncbi:MAG: hypothetical protein EXQ95_07065 [Alphaproteobacteria bacterium]|nr:hypothetical protein [Alphaproteobacteria bacterium]
MLLDRITVRAVEILADSTARTVGTGSIVYLKLTRVVSVGSRQALDSARTEFDKLPGDRRRSIRTDAITEAEKLKATKGTVAAIESMFKPLTPLDGKVTRLVVR